MRVLPNEIEFVEFLKKIGNGVAQKYPQYGQDIIEIPQNLIGNEHEIIQDIHIWKYCCGFIV